MDALRLDLGKKEWIFIFVSATISFCKTIMTGPVHYVVVCDVTSQKVDLGELASNLFNTILSNHSSGKSFDKFDTSHHVYVAMRMILCCFNDFYFFVFTGIWGFKFQRSDRKQQMKLENLLEKVIHEELLLIAYLLGPQIPEDLVHIFCLWQTVNY